jgi:Reverse transcriptase (RNA-dependent DNA polymerase)
MACRAITPHNKSNNPDVLSQAQMLRAKDSKELILHQRDEIDGLQDARVFAYKKRSTLPEGASILNSIWSYRRKHRPDGTLLKLKTQICADGSMQEQGRDFTDSYAPVVQWSSVRLCLILGIPTQQIDFTQAFCNANINEDVYIGIPQGWYYSVITDRLEQHEDPRFKDLQYCMQLVKNLYGTKQAARNWYLLLSETLTSEHHGFKAPKIDPCLFVREDCIVLVYTDDCIILGQDQATIDTLKKTLTEVDGFLHRTEGTLNNFLAWCPHAHAHHRHRRT